MNIRTTTSRLFPGVARMVVLSVIAAAGIVVSPDRAAAQAIPTIFLHGSSSTPPALTLDTIAPSAPTPKFADSASVAFSGGNPWKEIGTWVSSAVVTGTFSSLTAYVGLKNSDDQGTQFDLRAELYDTNGALIGSGQTNCVTGVTRNPDQAKNIVVSISQNIAGATKVKVLTRIGTTATGAFCGGHASATGLRFYFDAVSRPSQLARTGPLLAAPTLIRAISTSANTAFLIGRVDGAPNASITVQASTAASCTNGALPGGGTAAGNGSTTTDGNGYFGLSVSGIAPDNFVSVQLTTPSLSAASQCLAAAADNDSWPKALDITSASTPFSTTGIIDEPGKTRWFKFNVAPGQRIQVTLSGLPADYDLAVFKDILQVFNSALALPNPAALTKVAAEYAPSAFTPSAFTPSAFTPSAFTPSAFTPSAFTPSAFTPSAFTPSAFTPSAFTASAFSPSAFTPSAFTPSAFTPSAFTPSAFTPSAFTPSAFTGPGAFTVNEVLQAFSSAQTRSILGASATLGLGNESVVVNSWSNTGSFYVRVSSHGGAYSTAGKFTVTVDQGTTSCTGVTDTAITPAASRTVTSGSYTTVILTDSSSVRQNAGTTNLAGQALVDKLTTFAGRADIHGVVVDVASDARVQALKTQAQKPINTACPFAMNLVAQEIKGIVDAYRLANDAQRLANPALPAMRYVVIAGNDAAIPFFRYPDESLLGQESLYVPPLLSTSVSDASLRRDYVLSQDAYGSSVQISLRTSNYAVPGLAVGRLVETADDIGGLIDAYGDANGTVVPQSSLVTGYDFVADAANAVVAELGAGTGNTPDQLIAPNYISPQDPASWSAYKLSPSDNRPNLSGKLFGSRHDLVFLAGHFSANDALAADFTTSLLTTDLAGSTTDFKNSIVFSVGCHSGYNIVDADILPNVTQPVDWAQAFAGKQATLVAGTGYQYGDTDFIEYSERLYLNFAKQLRADNRATPTSQPTPIAVGEALVKAKLQYLAMTPDIRGLHQKVLLESTLFGLPMLGVNLPASGRATINAIASAITPDPVAAGTGGAPLGLMFKDLTYAPTAPLPVQTVTLNTVPPTSTYSASYLSGPDGVTSNPVEPVLPLVALNVTPTSSGMVLRGVGLRGSNYVDTNPVLPLTGAPATEIRGVHTQFLAAQFFPMRLWTTNYFPALGGAIGTNLLITPVQHRAADAVLGTTMRRVHTKLILRTYFSSNLSQAALSDAPAIVSVDGQFDGSGVAFTVRTVGDPAAGMQEVWITYTDGGGTWTPFDLVQCVNGGCGATNDSQLWKGHLTLATLPPNFQYIVQAANGIGLVSYDDKLGGYYTVGTPAATTLTLNAPPSTGVFGDSVAVNATLLASGAPVAGKIVTIGIGATAQVGVTDATGKVSVNVPVQTLPGNYQLTAAFGGDGSFLPASASAPFGVGPATTSLTWDPSNLTPNPTPPVVTLTASLGGRTTPLLQEAVKYVVSNGTVSKTLIVNTDYAARAPLAPTGLPAGNYTVSASYAGNATYSAASNTLPALTIVQQNVLFNGNASLPGSITVGGAPITFTVSSDTNQQVTVGLSPPPPNPYCTLTSAGGMYTLTAVAPGTCTVVASAGATSTSTSVSVSQDIAIKANQAITFAALPVKTFGDPDFAIIATSSSGLAVAFTASGNCSVTGNMVHITGAGSCTITASQDGSSLFNAATPVPQVLTINKASQAITFGALGAKTFGDPAFMVSATGGASGNPVTFAASGNCTVAGNTVAIIGAGSCTITASQAGNTNYNAAPDVAQSFAVAKAAQTITFGALGGKTFGDAPFPVSATASSGLAVTFGAAGSCTISGSTVTITGAGSCTITASQAGNSNYNAAANVVQSFNVAKGAQTITFGVLGSKTYGDAPFSVSATASSSLAVTFGAAGNCTIAGNTVTITAAGNCTITASQAGNANYNAAPDVPQSFTVAKAGQTINFPLISPTPTFVAGGTGTFTVAATGGASGNPVTFSSLTTGVCTVSGSTVTMKSAGICTLAADQAGNANYAAAVQVQQSVSIGKASQTITFAGPGNQQLGVPASNTVTLTATATSGLPVSFAATPPGVCTVSGATLTMVSAGSCTITASQAGDANFSAATPVVRTITISPADLPNMWTLLTNKMTTPRLFHTATRFESGPLAGQVLITGGYNRSGTTLKSSELYNPVLHTFVATGTMLTSSASHTATLLTNGKVVVFGGGNTAVQIFDPTPKTWSSVGTLSTSRSYHTATRLPDGRVLVIGGADNSGNTLSSTIVYDPTGSGSLANGPTLDTPRELHTATLLPNGKVLVVGGRKKSGSNYATLASYQLCGAAAPMGAVTCTASASGNAARFAHDAVALGPDGSKVLVAGGASGNTDLATTELYDSVAGTWSNAGLGSLAHTRSDLTLSPLPNGRALAAGGSHSGDAVKDADAYKPPVAPVAPMNVARAGHTATPLLDANGNITGILVVGGADTDADEDDALDSAEIYGTP